MKRPLYKTQRVLVSNWGNLSDSEIKALARRRFDEIWQDFDFTRVIDDVVIIKHCVLKTTLCEVRYHLEDLPF